MSELQEKMRDGELREIYGNHYGFKDVDSLKIEAVRARLVEDFGEDAVKKIEDRALKFYQAYLKDKSIKQDGINVAMVLRILQQICARECLEPEGR